MGDDVRGKRDMLERLREVEPRRERERAVLGVWEENQQPRGIICGEILTVAILWFREFELAKFTL